MTTVFDNTEIAPDFRRYREQWENALLSLTMLEHGAERDDVIRDLCSQWFLGCFNGHAHHVVEDPEEGFRSLEWQPASSTQIDLIYTAPYGAKCSLGRVYQQPNGSWGSLVVAGVKEDQYEAMAAAEWAVSRLSS